MLFLSLRGALAALLLCLTAATARTDVIVVDSAGGGDFIRVKDAVPAAQDGDVLLIRGEFPLDIVSIDKALTLIGDVGEEPPLVGALYIFNLPPGKTVRVRGLRLGSISSGFLKAALIAVDCEGALLVEDCEILQVGSFGEAFPDGWPAVRVTTSHHVGFTRSTVVGGAGLTATGIPEPLGSVLSGDGGAGIVVENGSVALWSSTVRGGDAGLGIAGSIPGGSGGPGITGDLAKLRIEGCLVEGGKGGTGCPGFPVACDGGTGLVLGASSSLLRRDSVIVGGLAGFVGDRGADFEAPDAVLASLPGGASQMSEPSPVRAGMSSTLVVSGPDGALAAWFFAFDVGVQALGGVKGSFALSFPLAGPYVLGTIPASGTLELDFVAGSLAGTGLDALVLGKQAVVLDADGLRFTGPTLYVNVGDTP